MKRLLSMCLTVLALGLLTTQAVHGQVKFANLGSADGNSVESRGYEFQEARRLADLKHGTFIAVRLNDGTKVTGHVVRFDANGIRLHVRTQAGAAPVAYSETDLKRIDVATREVDPGAAIVRAGFGSSEWRDLPGSSGLQENEHGMLRIKRNSGTHIRPAALARRDDNGAKPLHEESTTHMQAVIEPEITTQVIFNGNQRSVVYVTNQVSPGEREILEQMQKAENELLRLSTLKDQRENAIALEMALQEERLKNLKLINVTMDLENKTNYPYPPIPTTTVEVPLGVITRTGVPVVVTPTTRAPQKGVITQLPQIVTPGTSILERLPTVDPEAYAKARDRYAELVRAHAIFEDGRLVAVALK